MIHGCWIGKLMKTNHSTYTNCVFFNKNFDHTKIEDIDPRLSRYLLPSKMLAPIKSTTFD